MMRAGYAIDYDCLDPLQLQRTLEHKAISGLFSAGQANGTSGNEEAAAQGLLAGVNAMQKIRSKEPLILSRSEGYLGVLIDDLVTKGTNEPYRMMTSRAEYRLLLRQDNADLRLTEKGRAVGLVNDVRYEAFTAKRSLLERTLQNLSSTHLPPNAEVLAKLAELGTAPIRSGMSLLDLLRRSEMTYEKLQQAFEVPELPEVVAEQVEIFAKYEGYINKQKQEVEKALKLENKKIPADIDYLSIKELSSEAAEKLAADGIDAKVINIHTIKPLDEELVVAAAKETGRVVTVEEHSVIGGLGSAVCDVLSEKAPTRVMKIGINDTFGESGPALELLKKYGLDTDSIYEKIKAFACE